MDMDNCIDTGLDLDLPVRTAVWTAGAFPNKPPADVALCQARKPPMSDRYKVDRFRKVQITASIHPAPQPPPPPTLLYCIQYLRYLSCDFHNLLNLHIHLELATRTRK